MWVVTRCLANVFADSCGSSHVPSLTNFMSRTTSLTIHLWSFFELKTSPTYFPRKSNNFLNWIGHKCHIVPSSSLIPCDHSHKLTRAFLIGKQESVSCVAIFCLVYGCVGSFFFQSDESVSSSRCGFFYAEHTLCFSSCLHWGRCVIAAFI